MPRTVLQLAVAITLAFIFISPVAAQPAPSTLFGDDQWLEVASVGPARAAEERRSSDEATLDPLLRSLGADLADLAIAPVRMDRRAWRNLGIAAVAIGAVALVDKPIREEIRRDDSPATERFAHAIRPLGQEGGLALLGGFWLAGRATGNHQWEAIGRDGLEAVIISAGVITPALKLAAGRARPREQRGSSALFASDWSFPSGEATEAFAIAAVIAAHDDRRWVDVTAWLLAGTIAWQRMRLDAHWASDVLAGALIGASIGHWVVRRNDENRSGSWSVVPASSGKGFGLAIRKSF